MNEWMNEWMNERRKEGRKERTKEGSKQRRKEGRKKYMNEKRLQSKQRNFLNVCHECHLKIHKLTLSSEILFGFLQYCHMLHLHFDFTSLRFHLSTPSFKGNHPFWCKIRNVMWWNLFERKFSHFCIQSFVFERTPLPIGRDLVICIMCKKDCIDILWPFGVQPLDLSARPS